MHFQCIVVESINSSDFLTEKLPMSARKLWRGIPSVLLLARSVHVLCSHTKSVHWSGLVRLN